MTFRVTYATLAADDSELQAAYTEAVTSGRAELGAWHPLWIGDDERAELPAKQAEARTTSSSTC